ncbi:tetratricopeptide repeat protein [Arthrospira platensis SPKY2]
MSAGELLRQANQLKRSGKLKEAIALYHQVIDINPHFAWAYHGLGDAWAKQGNLDEAVAWYSECLKIHPDSAWLYYSLGDVLAELGDLEAAVKYLKNAIELKPDFDKFHHRLAQALTRFGDFDEANISYKKFLKLNSNKANINHRGESYLVKLNYSSNNLAELIASAEDAASCGAWADAVYHWEQAAEILEASGQNLSKKQKAALRETRLKLAAKFKVEGKLDQAALLYEAILAVTPEDLSALSGLAEIATIQESWEEAVGRWEQIGEIANAKGKKLPSVQPRRLQQAQTKLATDLKSILIACDEDVIAKLQVNLLRDGNFNAHAAFYRSVLDARYISQKTKDGVCLINDTRTQNNIGCRTTTNCLIEMLNTQKIHVANTLALAELSPMASLLWKVANSTPSPNNLDLMVDVFSEHKIFRFHREILKNQLAIIVNGEGSFYDEQNKGLILHVIAIYAKKVLGIPVAIINHSASLTHLLMTEWTRQAYALADFISLREEISFTKMPDIFPKQRIEISADAAFQLVRWNNKQKNVLQREELHYWPDELHALEFTRPYVVVSGTSAIMRPDREDFTTEHAQHFNEVCKTIKKSGFDVVLLASDKHDYRLLRQCALEINAPLVSASISISSVLMLLKDATAFISGRWHTSIIAACVGTPPVLGDANFFKTTALHNSLDLPWQMFEFRKLNFYQDSIIDAIRLANNPRIRQQVKRKADEFFNDLDRTVIKMKNNLSI